MTRILVTGSRDWKDGLAVFGAIGDACDGDLHNLTIVHGHCPTGADQFADKFATTLEVQVERHPAAWQAPCRPECPPGHRRSYARAGLAPRATYCPKAGHYRNQEMVDLGADVVLAFQRNHSRGTQDCIDRARAAGLTVVLKEAS